MSEERGVGLDVGTCFLVSARSGEKEKTEFTKIRDAFFSMPPNKMMMSILNKAGVGFINLEDKIVVVGDKALDFAATMGQELRRPMSRGVMSQDNQAESIMSILLEKVVGEPKFPTEVCRFSVPADPVDDDFDVIYHEGVFTTLLGNMGYNPKPINEAEAVAYSELSSEEDNLTGVSISCGAGMSNIAVMYMGQSITTFSVARGGDWIDEHSYKLGMFRSAAEMTSFKEQGEIDLMNPEGRSQTALATYYRHHAKYIVENLVKQLNKAENIPNFSEPVRVVLSGGTSLAQGFVGLVKSEIGKIKLPFAVREVFHARDPLTATANGCYVAARLDEEDD